MAKFEVSTNGVGLGGLLFVLFVGLKLTGYIAWPWLWVAAPLWIPLLLGFGIVGVILLFLLLVAVLK